MFGNFFCLAIGFFYTTSEELPTAHLSKKESRYYRFLRSKHLQNKKVFQAFLLLALPCGLCILSMEKIIRARQWRFVYTVFCRAFHGASFEKKSRFYHFFRPKYKCGIKSFTNILLQHQAHLHFL
jgi:hypothetical protein